LVSELFDIIVLYLNDHETILCLPIRWTRGNISNAFSQFGLTAHRIVPNS
jgi:hypothetical protein